MEIKTLLRTNLNAHRGTALGILALLALVSLSLCTVLTVGLNSSRYVDSEMERLGYGDITAWVSGLPEAALLAQELSALDEVASVGVQPLLFSEYEIGEQESDSEGQLITYDPVGYPYKFFSDDLSGYQAAPAEIAPGEVYVCASLVSMFGVEVGDTITFPIARSGGVDHWLGPNGEGLMDAFNPADLHIAAQPMGETSLEEVERTIRSYTAITDEYDLAMPSVSVNGVDMTANVITQPERFHLLSGDTCRRAEEILLTEFVAADLGVSVGDTVTVAGALGSREYVVSGIYQCANDMGMNVGLSREGYARVGRETGNIRKSSPAMRAEE